MPKIPNVLLELSFLSLGLKTLVYGAGFPEALVLVTLVFAMGFTQFLTKSKREDKEEILNQINELKNKLEEKQKVLESRISNLKSDQIQKAEKLNEKKQINIDPNKRFF